MAYIQTYSSKKSGLIRIAMGVVFLILLLSLTAYIVLQKGGVSVVFDLILSKSALIEILVTLGIVSCWLLALYAFSVNPVLQGLIEIKSLQDWKVYIDKERFTFVSANQSDAPSFDVLKEDIDEIIHEIRVQTESDDYYLNIVLHNGGVFRMTESIPFDISLLVSRINEEMMDVVTKTVR